VPMCTLYKADRLGCMPRSLWTAKRKCGPVHAQVYLCDSRLSFDFLLILFKGHANYGKLFLKKSSIKLIYTFKNIDAHFSIDQLPVQVQSCHIKHDIHHWRAQNPHKRNRV
jgi:hypothetical protein